MKVLYLLSIIFFVACSFAEEPKDTTISSTPETTPFVPTTTSSEKPSTETTTPKSTEPPTTTPKPTPPPTTPKTTTPETTTPKTTTPETTTPKTTPETTTPKTTPETTTPKTTPKTTTPQTTTPAPKTTTPVPVTTKSPIPDVEECSWNITSGNTTCIRASLKILLKIDLSDRTEYIALTQNASSSNSNCNPPNNATQELVLQDKNYILSFIFEKKSDVVYVRNTSFTYYIGSSETATNNSQMFTVKTGNSYLCTVESDVVLESNVTMEIMSIKIQAFGSENNHGFGTAEECEADNKVSDIVPIAVGIALLALVVVVLIAYLIGRRRSRQKGYQSV